MPVSFRAVISNRDLSVSGLFLILVIITATPTADIVSIKLSTPNPDKVSISSDTPNQIDTKPSAMLNTMVMIAKNIAYCQSFSVMAAKFARLYWMI